MLKRITEVLDAGQTALVYLAARFGPITTGLGPTYFVYRALSRSGVHEWVAILLGLSMEFVGLAGTALVLRMMKWERVRAKTKDDAAPLWMAWAAVIMYGIAGLTITVALEFFPIEGPKLVGGLFVILNLASFGVLALNSDQARREQDREDRLASAKKRSPKPKAVEPAKMGTPKELTWAALEEADKNGELPGLTVRELASRAGVAVGTASNWKRAYEEQRSNRQVQGS